MKVERVVEISRLIDQESEKLKRHHKYSRKKVVQFWDAVWEILRTNPDLITEDAILKVQQEQGLRK